MFSTRGRLKEDARRYYSDYLWKIPGLPQCAFPIVLAFLELGRGTHFDCFYKEKWVSSTVVDLTRESITLVVSHMTPYLLTLPSLLSPRLTTFRTHTRPFGPATRLQLKIGDSCDAVDHEERKWHGVVKDKLLDMMLVHFSGWGSSYDEWIIEEDGRLAEYGALVPLQSAETESLCFPDSGSYYSNLLKRCIALSDVQAFPEHLVGKIVGFLCVEIGKRFDVLHEGKWVGGTSVATNYSLTSVDVVIDTFQPNLVTVSLDSPRPQIVCSMLKTTHLQYDRYQKCPRPSREDVENEVRSGSVLVGHVYDVKDLCGDFYHAKVHRIWLGRALVHFIGWDECYAEWVPFGEGRIFPHGSRVLLRPGSKLQTDLWMAPWTCSQCDRCVSISIRCDSCNQLRGALTYDLQVLREFPLYSDSKQLAEYYTTHLSMLELPQHLSRHVLRFISPLSMVGERLDVFDTCSMKWVPGTVTEVRCGYFHCELDGLLDRSAVWINSSTECPRVRVGDFNEYTKPMEPVPAHRRVDASRIIPGDKYQVADFQGQWYKATILSVHHDGKVVCVSFEGWGSQYDERLGTDMNRIRTLQ